MHGKPRQFRGRRRRGGAVWRRRRGRRVHRRGNGSDRRRGPVHVRRRWCCLYHYRLVRHSGRRRRRRARQPKRHCPIWRRGRRRKWGNKHGCCDCWSNEHGRRRRRRRRSNGRRWGLRRCDSEVSRSVHNHKPRRRAHIQHSFFRRVQGDFIHGGNGKHSIRLTWLITHS